MQRIHWAVAGLPLARAFAMKPGETHPTNATVPINSTLDRDPYLDYQPQFADSLPTQILLTGLVFSLTFVLFLFLLFSMRSHWPRARLNYALQLSGVVTLLSALIATLVVVMHATYAKSREWPYMLDYVAVTLPLSQWSKGGLIAWYSLEALVSGIVNITHIQFLTLLYPSSVEVRLIFFLLGPLAVASSGMEFAALLETNEAQDLGQSIRDICNSTLTLLFTSALFIWGFVLNRQNAWRTDGGTAIFGTAALCLAVMSTTMNFVQITEEGLEWLPGLSWALILWQSFLGWWWWVGSVPAFGDVEDFLIQEQKRKEAKRRQRRRREMTRLPSLDAEGSSRAETSSFRPRSILGRLGRSSMSETESSPRRRKIPGAPSLSQPRERDGSELQVRSAMSSAEAPGRTSIGRRVSHNASPSGMLTNPRRFWTQISQFSPSAMLRGSWATLRHAHHAAAQSQALEQIKIQEETGLGIRGSMVVPGWSLGSGGHREFEVAQIQLRELETERQESRLIPNSTEDRSVTENDDVTTRSQSLHATTVQYPPPALIHAKSSAESGPWWWGPVRRWRLQDRTTY